MSFKIKNNVIDLLSVTNSALNFTQQFSGYSRNQTSPLNCSFTDDQGFLWDEKGIAAICANRSMFNSSSRTASDGLNKKIYQTGKDCLKTGYTCYVNNWTENNSNLPGNVCADKSNHSATNNSCCRYVFDSVYWGQTNFLLWEGQTADGCLKRLRLV